MSGSASKPNLLLIAFFCSGVAALGYEVLWTRLLALYLGHESLAVAGVLMGFFLGLAGGSYLLDNWILRADNPVKWFMVLEGIAALYAVASPFVIDILGDMIRIPSPHAGDPLLFQSLLVSMTIAALSLFPATFCMGATLAALTQAYRRMYRGEARGVGVGMLYAVNTLGATVGVLATVYLVMPLLGLRWSAGFLSLFAIAAIILAGKWSGQQTGLALSRPRSVGLDSTRKKPVIPILLFLTGLVGLGYEVVGVQILAQSSRGTIYTFAHTLAVFLIFTSLGSWLYARHVHRERGAKGLLPKLLAGYAVAMLVSSLFLHGFMHRLLMPLHSGPIPELIQAVLFFGGPAAFMGAIFSHLVGSLAGSIGRAYGWNTMGAALAPLVFGAICVHTIGFTLTFYLLVLIVVLIMLFVSFFNKLPVRQIGLFLVGPILLGVIAPHSLQTIRVEEGWTSIWAKEGMMGTVMATEQVESAAQQPPMRRLQVNQRFYMGGEAGFAERRMGHLPLLLANKPERALFLGVGTGSTLSAVKVFPVKKVDAVELVPGVVESLPMFDRLNDGVYDDSRVSIYITDARRFLKSGSISYDLIVADLYHPFKDGAAFLYTKEYFDLVRTRLSTDGIFVQWLPLYQLDRKSLNIILNTFLAEYPDASAFLGLYNAKMPTLALVSHKVLPLPVERIQETLEYLPTEKRFFKDLEDVMGSFVMDAAHIKAMAGDTRINTDYFPIVLTRAPSRDLERQDSGPARLKELLEYRSVDVNTVMGDDPDLFSEIRGNFPGYALAVETYLKAELLLEEAGEEPNEKVVEQYLAAYKLSSRFSPAKGRLLQIAGRDEVLAEQIYAGMLNSHPSDLTTYRSYLFWLQNHKRNAQMQQVLDLAKRHLPPAEFASLFKR